MFRWSEIEWKEIKRKELGKKMEFGFVQMDRKKNERKKIE